MPSIAPRPLHLVFPKVQEQHYHREDGPETSSFDSSDADSEVSDSSTITNSPLSCYYTSKPNPIEPAPTDDSTVFSDCSVTSETEVTTIGPQQEQDTSYCPEIDESSVSSNEESDCDDLASCSSSCEDASDAAQQEQEPLDKTSAASSTDSISSSTQKKNKKKSVGFDALSTLYVFEDVDYDIDNTWYSSHELKTFRADAFLTVNWLLMKNIKPENKKVLQDLNIGFGSNHSMDHRFRRKCTSKKEGRYCYYSNKYGYDRQKEIQAIAQQADYEFCERGIECRTPLGRYKKNKRRVEAMRVVMLYQQMQKQHRRERKREERRQQQQQHQEDDDMPARMIRRHQPDPEARKRIEADIDADALSNVYGAYCKDSASEALAKGQTDAIAVGMPTAAQQQQQQQINEQTAHDCSSLSDKDDEFMDKLISLSFVDHDDSDSDMEDEGSTTSSITSENSLSLEDLVAEGSEEEDPEEVSGVVEVELVEGNTENPHRIYCFEESMPRRKSWSHPEYKSALSSTSLPIAAAQQKLEAPPTSASFSSLELGGLFLGAVTGLDWW